MHDPIEGRFQVLGEKQPYEPAIKNWPGLWFFIGMTVLACLLSTGKVMLENSRGDGSGDAGRSAPTEQTATRPLALEHLPQ